ncbi:amino acid permease/ SLC12A domain-containing protein [Fimicolochytrium jonesii]|uniref:amino acid permease/ SLC12A domain-containing protein n=1 Tax=Fimicolochytrium jonesii TaxID=1396493 RepID=UPI0022FE92EE|nr:amino acid permease/ SLC12A domain-containing protein [Fimicolochytrium jonesii]KAI8818940.1 amino acid permease/ SLC12A domain-containing protein [Fimicolochytrium jonesii]
MSEKATYQEDHAIHKGVSESTVYHETPLSNGTLEDGVKRDLKTRHISMISIGGTIGTGLFVASAGNIANAGPLGALLAYLFMGFTVYCIMTCLGEMATLIPVSGSFNHYGGRFIDPALGFALGWNYWISWGTALATELVAFAVVIDYWGDTIPHWAWALIVLGAIIALNLVGGKGYGESEYWLSIIKIIVVIIFIIVGILVASGAVGGHTYGFENWGEDRAINVAGAYNNGFVNWFATLITVGFAYMGTELVGIAAGESRNPRKAVPKAIRNVFWRILVFFLGSVFFMGLIIRSDDPSLVESESGARAVVTAPFTTVFQKANIGPAADIINAVLLTVLFSAANSALYSGSRILMALAREGKAPAFVGRTNGRGVPIYALAATSLFGFAIALVQVFSPDGVFPWILGVSSISGFISWAAIGFTHIRFRQAYIAQGRDIKALPYKAIAYPFTAWWGGIMCTIIIIFSGFSSFTPEWNVSMFLQTYICVFIFILTFVGYKIVKRTRIIPLMEVDLDTGVRWADIKEEQDEAARTRSTNIFVRAIQCICG